MTANGAATLAITDLNVAFPSARGNVHAVRDLSLTVAPGECLAVVGESGSGKTQSFMAVMGLLARSARTSGSVRFEGEELLSAPAARLNRFRGAKLAMIFQNPMTCLTPHLTIGTQMAEVLVEHAARSWRDARHAALDMLARVGLTDPQRRLGQFPHELSGGMRQRVMIGASLLCGPRLLIADEPTTALDVTVQAQILALLRGLRAEFRSSLVLISHDLGVVAGLADRIMVMYAGRAVEVAEAARLLANPRHPYTQELLKCVPDLQAPRLERMPYLPGVPPDPAFEAPGCAFAPRCPRAADRCRVERPLLRALPGGEAACHFPG